MPRRNEKLVAGKVYWIKQKDGTGYHVWSEETLQRMIDDGELDNGEIVQISQVGTGVTLDDLPE